MIKSGVSAFDPPSDLVDAFGVTPKLSEGERVLWIGTPGWLSSFLCVTTVATPALLFAAFLQCGGFHLMTAARELTRTQWTVLGLTVFAAFIPQLLAVRLGGAFAYILTTKRMFVKVDRANLFCRVFRSFGKVVDADGFAAYDLKYLNGARVYAGLRSYGNISVIYNVGVTGELRGDLSTYGSDPVFFRDRRYVKVFYRQLACFHVGESFSNVYFGIKDVGRLGDVLNDQCAARLDRATLARPT